MRSRIDGILAAASTMAWAIIPERLQAMFEMLQLRADLRDARRPGFVAQQPRRPMALSQGGGKMIAVLPVHGVLSQRMNLMTEISGGTSTEMLAAQFEAALQDPRVSAIVLDVDSPGGAVNGVAELADRIASARGQKKVVAVANTTAASAAYWIASAADELVASPSSTVGSIGVFTVHADESRAAEEAGIKFTLIKAGKYKAEGNSYEPLSDEARDGIQTNVDAIYGQFVASVAKFRKVPAASVRGGYGQGREVPAQLALQAGMVDRIATLDDVLIGLGAPRGAALPRAAAQERPPKMVAPAAFSPNSPLFVVSDGLLFNANRRAEGADPKQIPGGHRDDEASLDPTGDPPAYTPGECPEDGMQLDPTGTCPQCGYVDPEGPSAPDDDEDDKDPTNDEIDPQDLVPQSSNTTGLGGVRAGAASHPDTGPSAKDTTMTATPAAASNGAVPAVDDRAAGLVALAHDHGKTTAELQQWMASGKTVAQVGADLLAAYRQKATPLTPAIHDVHDRAADKPFKSFAEQLVAVMIAGQTGGTKIDPRLKYEAAAAGSSETIPSDGGFMVQADFSTEILKRVYELGEVLSRCRKVPISSGSNSLKINAIDETSRVTGSRYGGVQTFWANEADTVTAKKPRLRRLELTLNKVFGLWYLTDELMADATALETVAQDAFGEELIWTVENSIFNGVGAGQPLGILNSPAAVTVTKETGQATQTILSANVLKMWSRMWGRSRRNAVWFVTQDCEPQLFQLTIGGTNAVWPVYLPPSKSLADAPNGTLMGRPVFPSEYVSAFSSQGDIVLVDLNQYLIIDKGGAETAQSIHVRFITDEMTFRFTYRIDGQPIWYSALTQAQGASANTLSPYVLMGSR